MAQKQCLLPLPCQSMQRKRTTSHCYLWHFLLLALLANITHLTLLAIVNTCRFAFADIFSSLKSIMFCNLLLRTTNSAIFTPSSWSTCFLSQWHTQTCYIAGHVFLMFFLYHLFIFGYCFKIFGIHKILRFIVLCYSRCGIHCTVVTLGHP